MHSFLRTPYLLDMAARIDWNAGSLPKNAQELRERCWRDLVRNDARAAAGMPRRRQAAFIEVARRRAAELRPYVTSGTDDAEALDALQQASILICSPESDQLFAPAHDVLEAWAILHW